MKKTKKFLAFLLALSLMLATVSVASFSAGAVSPVAVCAVAVVEQNVGSADYFIAADVTFTSDTAFTAGMFTVEAEGLTFTECTATVAVGGDAPQLDVNYTENKVLFTGFDDSTENDVRSYTKLTLSLKFTVTDGSVATPAGTTRKVSVKNISIANFDGERYRTDDAEGSLHTHAALDSWEKNETDHWHVCTVCTAELDKAAHTYNSAVTEPTCTEGGFTTYTCTVCGYSYVADETDALGHDWGDWQITTPATCTEAGEETRVCKRDASHTEKRDIEAAGHVVGEWLSDENNHWHECTSCSGKLDEAAHTAGNWIIDTPATKEADGSKHKECTVCGRVLETEIIPQLSEYTPGDINDDGEVDNKDLIRLFQYLSEWDVTVNADALDVNGDGTSDNKDLIRLFQYLSEWGVEIF